MTTAIVNRKPWIIEPDHEPEPTLNREWLLANGLGGYASGTVAGVATRRYHGWLVAAVSAPLGRVMMFNHLSQELRLPGGTVVSLDYQGPDQKGSTSDQQPLAEFCLELGLPVWTYRAGGYRLEKRVVMPNQQNTTYIKYRLLAGAGSVRLRLRPAVHFRHHENPVSGAIEHPYSVSAVAERVEIAAAQMPTLRLLLLANTRALVLDGGHIRECFYLLESLRGYESRGMLWSPGYFKADLRENEDATLIASTEDWETIEAITPRDAFDAETVRRRHLVEQANPAAKRGIGAELVLAADQFLISPVGRTADTVRAHATGDETRSIIAGYHWFTDWGRDTMISLEGLTLVTGQQIEAGRILRMFANHIRDGLIPNMFPEGEQEGLYHTADASLWYFHAIHRYVETNGDRVTLRTLLPGLRDIVAHHVRGTRFNIHVDEKDGLLWQGHEGYQLTWMDAKVGDWVVTPRRGKAVEINALWYNALRLLQGWLDEEGDATASRKVQSQADRAFDSFNRRFWNESTGCLYDVIDGPDGDDPSCRPNQIFAISLDCPVLEQNRWKAVIDTCTQRLLTPMGLRSLAPGEPDYKPRYDGDLRSRDAAYHQGTAWAWLIGPFIDAWLRVHEDDRQTARQFLEGFGDHLGEACLGSISEIFDAESPYYPRGCIAQAWSVAEVLRSWVKTDRTGAVSRESLQASVDGTA